MTGLAFLITVSVALVDTVYLSSHFNQSQSIDQPYAVSLQGVEGLPAAEKISAEVRFVKAIESALGGADAVVSVYRAWREASENEATEVRKETWALAC